MNEGALPVNTFDYRLEESSIQQLLYNERTWTSCSYVLWG